jgi:hypothetical protein
MVSVEGVATVAISKTASPAEANAAYRQGLVAAIADGLEKAEFLAGRTGAKVGSIQQIAEQGGWVGCEAYAEVGSQIQGEPYEGARPDFGSVTSPGTRPIEVAPARAPALAAPGHAKKRKKKGTRKAKKAGGVRCTLSTQVVLSYSLT